MRDTCSLIECSVRPTVTDMAADLLRHPAPSGPPTQPGR
ncbi:Protein of unknown function [Propionibacterium freudenreichii]|nr:Protein of unknown function [Propionibacterium freudenreichii subsp. freudenreichii]CEG89471.1 Protein of unknown function [Propionibacterium freudenreichii]CEG94038.1 Protein of unknown function [Propionibacterium freudenreichii]CEG97700.1 Protein of unknown function [Propionibacterium freudenreichii]CEG98364.1 Protein of unknown function [Propionibacterium freudenreichii]